MVKFLIGLIILILGGAILAGIIYILGLFANVLTKKMPLPFIEPEGVDDTIMNGALFSLYVLLIFLIGCFCYAMGNSLIN